MLSQRDRSILRELQRDGRLTMQQLADKGDGNYYYVDSYDEAKRVFGQNLSGTVKTIARDVKVQVEFDPDVVLSYRLVGYENRDIADEDFRNDTDPSVRAVYDFVGVDPNEPATPVPLPELERQTAPINRAWTDRFKRDWDRHRAAAAATGAAPRSR